ncbi:helix-turn-helix transcriptional regulator [Streptomyces pratensis]|uniref:helix-turn-helix transcriptional regulator n=1 Tax=Streptomyces pratensis TaxID=1169025 RepID=UPI00301908B0
MDTTRGCVRQVVFDALAAAGADPLLVLVEGVAGMGKSHLLRELGASPQAADAVRQLWQCGDPGARPEAEPPLGTHLLLVDDVHRADEEEQRRLRRVVERPWPGLVAVLAYRPEDIPPHGLLLGAPAVVYPPELTVLRYRLEPWGEARVRRAAADALGDGVTAEAAGRLYERSGGVPQVVTDLLTIVRKGSGQARTARDVDAAGVPVRLSELLLDRIWALPPGLRPIVWAAAVLDAPSTRRELVEVSGLGPAEGREALMAAVAGAALTERDEGCYGLPVPLAAPAVHASVPGPVRQEMHQRAGEVLARRQPVPWFAVAGHRRAAGGGPAWLRAVEKAARGAAEAGRHQGAISLLEQALASSLVPPHARARLAPLLARSAVVGLRSDQTVEVLTQIVRDASLPATVRGELRLDLGLMLCNQAGKLAVGWRELEIAAAELQETRPDLAGRAMAALSMPYWPGPAVAVHRRWLGQAMAAADASGDEALLAAATAGHATLAMSCGDRVAWELVKALPTESPDPVCRRHAARGLCNAADAAVWLGFYERAQGLLAEGLDLSARSGAPYTEHTARGTLLLLEWWAGRWPGLAEQCEKFVGATSDMPFIAWDARLVRGLLALAQGDWGAAVSWLSGQDAIAAENMPTPLAATAAGALIRLALARQDVPAAAEQARRAWSAVAEKGIWAWAAELAPWAVEATARAGDTAAARAMVEDFARGIADHDVPVARAALVWSRAALAEEEGRQDEAARLHREAATAYGALSRPYAQALAAEGAARCLLAVRPPSSGGSDGDGASSRAVPEEGEEASASAARAIAGLEECTERFSALGAVWDAARSRALLRTRQPAKRGRPPGRPSHADRLSPREEEVAELAGRGLTNREIAATLHLSPRTVEQHIARAMRKTGTLSRHDLAHRRP